MDDFEGRLDELLGPKSEEERHRRIVALIGENVKLRDQAARDRTSRGARSEDRLFVNDERTVLARFWADGTVEVARRDHPSHTWGPPVYLKEER